MSVWSSISGEVSFLQSQTTSLRKLAEECFGDEYTIKDTRTYPDFKIVVDFNISFCLDGDEAMKAANKFQKLLKERSPACLFDIETTIRYLY